MDKKDIIFTERFRRGYEHLETFDGENMWRMNGQYEENPDAARFTSEYVFGDIYLRDGISMKDRKTVIIAALMSKGTCPNPLLAQMEAFLDCGGTINDLREMLLLCQMLGGVPNSGNSTGRLRELLAARKEKGIEDSAPEGLFEYNLGEETRNDRGHENMKKYGLESGKAVVDALRPHFPDLLQYYQEFIFCDMYERTRLDRRTFHLFVLAFLAQLQTDSRMMKLHIQAALSDGITLEDINEIAIILSGYLGFSAAFKLAADTNDLIGG